MGWFGLADFCGARTLKPRAIRSWNACTSGGCVSYHRTARNSSCQRTTRGKQSFYQLNPNSQPKDPYRGLDRLNNLAKILKFFLTKFWLKSHFSWIFAVFLVRTVIGKIVKQSNDQIFGHLVPKTMVSNGLKVGKNRISDDILGIRLKVWYSCPDITLT